MSTLGNAGFLQAICISIHILLRLLFNIQTFKTAGFIPYLLSKIDIFFQLVKKF